MKQGDPPLANDVIGVPNTTSNVSMRAKMPRLRCCWQNRADSGRRVEAVADWRALPRRLCRI